MKYTTQMYNGLPKYSFMIRLYEKTKLLYELRQDGHLRLSVLGLRKITDIVAYYVRNYNLLMNPFNFDLTLTALSLAIDFNN